MGMSLDYRIVRRSLLRLCRNRRQIDVGGKTLQATLERNQMTEPAKIGAADQTRIGAHGRWPDPKAKRHCKKEAKRFPFAVAVGRLRGAARPAAGLDS